MDNFVPDGIGIISNLLGNRISKYEESDSYLKSRIAEVGYYTEEDELRASAMLLVSKNHRALKRIAKTIKKSDELYNSIYGVGVTSKEQYSDEFFDYFMDRASLIDEENVQTLFAGILAEEVHQPGRFKKVMLDRMAMLDKETATAFASLCSLTYQIETTLQSVYMYPLYIRDSSLMKMCEKKSINFCEDDAIKYQKIRPSENVMMQLQEIGLITLSEEFDESDIYASSKFGAKISVDEYEVYVKSKKAKKLNYYIITGAARYTSCGLALYNALANLYKSDSCLINTLNAFLQLQ